MELVLVHYSSARPELMLPAWSRIKEFCMRYESDADHAILFEEVTRNYFSATPNMLIYVGLIGGEIAAHAVATIDNYYGHKCVNLLQYWKQDEVKVPDEVKIAVLVDLIRWGKEAGTDKLRIWARNEEIANIFERKYGFKRDQRIIMNTSLTEMADRIAELPAPEEEEEKSWVEEQAQQPQPISPRN